jgi:hypothetical protein
MYRLFKDHPHFGPAQSIYCISDSAIIPFDPANFDYQRFKFDILNDVELQDPEGNVLSAEEAKLYVASLP